MKQNLNKASMKTILNLQLRAIETAVFLDTQGTMKRNITAHYYEKMDRCDRMLLEYTIFICMCFTKEFINKV